MLLNTNTATIPCRGEVWWVAFDPTLGSEIKKIRPAVVISSDSIGRLPLKIVLPITEWNDIYGKNIWHVKIIPDDKNGLEKDSAVDALQVRSVSLERFNDRLGYISADLLEEIIFALAAVVEYK